MDERAHRRPTHAEATLGAFPESTRSLIAPLLTYKSVFLGEWFTEVVRQEPDEKTREFLLRLSRDTLRETIQLLATMRAWDAARLPPERHEELASTLQRRLVEDLLILKEGSNEVVAYTAMHAPSRSLRDELLALADVDRVHADGMRALKGGPSMRRAQDRARRERDADETLGAHTSRGEHATLLASLRARVDAAEEAGARVSRLVVSDLALRHLRDEGAVAPDGRVLGRPVDVDFGWRGECYSLVTNERVRLTELLTFGHANEAGEAREARD